MLGRIHAASAERADLANDFADKSFFDELRIDPYLRYVASRAPAIAPALDEVAAELLATGVCLVHGDFSPKNLLVPPHGGVLLVDHEVAHWGHPAFDVAFVTNHLCLKAIRFRADDGAERYLRAAATVLDAYAEEAGHLELGVGRFAARTVGALLLARVDGKSPVEYLTDERDRAARPRPRHEHPPGTARRTRGPWSTVSGRRSPMPDLRIERVVAREILDSRGQPTVEADVVLASGVIGRRVGAVRRLHGHARGGRAT